MPTGPKGHKRPADVNDPAVLDSALRKIVQHRPEQAKPSATAKK
jgi:hypothetical protein